MEFSNVLSVHSAALPFRGIAIRSSQVSLRRIVRIGVKDGKQHAAKFPKNICQRVVQASSSEDDADKGQTKVEDVPVPSWAQPGSEESPPWAKNESSSSSQEHSQDVPFPVYLLGSTIVAIAAVGSVFEYFNRNPVFGVIQSDSPFYTPILGLFAITGLPMSGFLFYKSIELANKASEEADKEDGVRR